MRAWTFTLQQPDEKQCAFGLIVGHDVLRVVRERYYSVPSIFSNFFASARYESLG